MSSTTVTSNTQKRSRLPIPARRTSLTPPSTPKRNAAKQANILLEPTVTPKANARLTPPKSKLSPTSTARQGSIRRAPAEDGVTTLKPTAPLIAGTPKAHRRFSLPPRGHNASSKPTAHSKAEPKSPVALTAEEDAAKQEEIPLGSTEEKVPSKATVRRPIPAPKETVAPVAKDSAAKKEDSLREDEASSKLPNPLTPAPKCTAAPTTKPGAAQRKFPFLNPRGNNASPKATTRPRPERNNTVTPAAEEPEEGTAKQGDIPLDSTGKEATPRTTTPPILPERTVAPTAGEAREAGEDAAKQVDIPLDSTGEEATSRATTPPILPEWTVVPTAEAEEDAVEQEDIPLDSTEDGAPSNAPDPPTLATESTAAFTVDDAAKKEELGDGVTTKIPAPMVPSPEFIIIPTAEVDAAKQEDTPQASAEDDDTSWILVPSIVPPGTMPTPTAQVDAAEQTNTPIAPMEGEATSNAPAFITTGPPPNIADEQLDGTDALKIPPKPQEGEASCPEKTLQSLDLRDEKLDILGPGIVGLIRDAFPGVQAMTEGRYRAYLNLTFKTLPPEPWPLTVGGIPLTIATGTQGRGPLFPRPPPIGDLRVCSLRHYTTATDAHPATDAALRQMAAEIHDLFRGCLPDLGPPMEFILTSEHFVYLVFPRRVDLAEGSGRIPGKMGGVRVGYLWDEDIRGPGMCDGTGDPTVEPQLAHLFGRGVRSAEKWSDAFYHENPFCKDIEPMGVLVAKSARLMQDGPPPPLQHPRRAIPRFAVYDWAYTSQVKGRQPGSTEGAPGSVLWDGEGVVRGVLQYHFRDGPFDGFCVSLSASEVEVLGGLPAKL